MVKMLGAMLEGTVVSLEIFFLTLLFALPLALPMPTTPYMWMRSGGTSSTAMIFAFSPTL